MLTEMETMGCPISAKTNMVLERNTGGIPANKYNKTLLCLQMDFSHCVLNQLRSCVKTAFILKNTDLAEHQPNAAVIFVVIHMFYYQH